MQKAYEKLTTYYSISTYKSTVYKVSSLTKVNNSFTEIVVGQILQFIVT